MELSHTNLPIYQGKKTLPIHLEGIRRFQFGSTNLCLEELGSLLRELRVD